MKEFKALCVFGIITILGLIFTLWVFTKPNKEHKPQQEGMRQMINHRLSDIANNTNTLPPKPPTGGILQREVMLRPDFHPDHLVNCRDINNQYRDECTHMKGIFKSAHKP